MPKTIREKKTVKVKAMRFRAQRFEGSPNLDCDGSADGVVSLRRAVVHYPRKSIENPPAGYTQSGAGQVNRRSHKPLTCIASGAPSHPKGERFSRR